jgi:hypothetical protein
MAAATSCAAVPPNSSRAACRQRKIIFVEFPSMERSREW